MGKQDLKIRRKLRRKLHVRKHIHGSAERLRLTVFKSLHHIYVQLIDDDKKQTILSASTMDKEISQQIKPEMKKVDKSKVVGAAIAKRALANNIKTVTFDRNGYLYHGRVKALAEAARENGLVF
jgi:large subunit ribosomal protein L18